MMDKKKIWVICDNYFISGGLRSSYEAFSSALGDEHRVITNSSKRQRGNGNVIGIWNPLIYINLFRAISVFIALLRLSDRRDAIYIIAGSPITALLSIFSGRKISLWIATPFYDELLSQMKTGDFSWKDKVIRSFELLLLPTYYLLENLVLLNRRLRIFSNSRQTADKFLFSSKIKTLYPPIGHGWFTVDGESESRSGVLSVGRFTDPRKNLALILKTAAVFPQIDFHVVGVTPERVMNSSIKNVIFHGRLAGEGELRELFDRCAIFYLPSFQEGLGMVYIEAMARGCAVISTRNGGAEEIIENEVNGILMDRNDLSSSVKAFRRLFDAPQLLRTIATRGRAYAKDYLMRSEKQMRRFLMSQKGC